MLLQSSALRGHFHLTLPNRNENAIHIIIFSNQQKHYGNENVGSEAASFMCRPTKVLLLIILYWVWSILVTLRVHG